MLVIAFDPYGTVKEFICDHDLLSEYDGKQRPLAKFLTKSKVEALEEEVPPSVFTTYNKAWDRNSYKYKKEPKGGDFHKRTTLSSGVEVEESDSEEFAVDLPNDGRVFAQALLYDFVVKHGRKAKTADVSSSQAYISVKNF